MRVLHGSETQAVSRDFRCRLAALLRNQRHEWGAPLSVSPSIREDGVALFLSRELGLNIPTDMMHYGMTKTAQLAISRGAHAVVDRRASGECGTCEMGKRARAL